MWRQHALAFLAKNFPALLSDPQELHKLTYVQVAECHGIKCLSSPRERNVLNILSRMPKVGPLGSTLANFDISQAIHRCSLRADGTVGTMATGAVIYNLQDAGPECAYDGEADGARCHELDGSNSIIAIQEDAWHELSPSLRRHGAGSLPVRRRIFCGRIAG